jgi:hypothetical protein
MVLLEFRGGLAVRYLLPRRQRMEGSSIRFVRELLFRRPLPFAHFFAFSARGRTSDVGAGAKPIAMRSWRKGEITPYKWVHPEEERWVSSWTLMDRTALKDKTPFLATPARVYLRSPKNRQIQ